MAQRLSRVLRLSDQFYRWLLVCYPAEFRDEYGLEMAQLFRDRCREKARHRSRAGIFVLWLHMLADVAVSAPREHMHILKQDLRYAFRLLQRSPGFTLTVVLTLALGIGATTAIFSVVNGVLIKSLPYPRADELVAISHAAPGANFGGEVGMSPSMLFTYRAESRVFQSIGGWIPNDAIVTGLAEPERTRVMLVTYGTLQALGVRPLLGRELSQEDDTPGAPDVVLLSYGYWQRRFGGDRGVVGHSLTVDSRPRQIVGVMPQFTFRFMGQNPDLFIPLRLERSRLHLGDLSFQGIGRLKPGITLTEANADIGRMLPIWLRSWPAPGTLGKGFFENARFSPTLRPLKNRAVESVGNALWLILGTVGLVLVIACANVASLLLVRAESRRHERGIRLALGASRARILRQSFTESMLLGAVGGVLGLAVAFGGLTLLRFLRPSTLPRLDEIVIDAPVLLFAVAISLLACLLFGLVPALKFGRKDLAPDLSVGGRSGGASRERLRAQNLLVIGQVAMAQVLLVIAGLMLRTFQEIRKVEPGFTQPDQVHTFRVAITGLSAEQPARVLTMLNEMLERIAAIPGVSAVGLTNSLPMDEVKNQNPIVVENMPAEPGRSSPVRTFKFVSPGVLPATGTRVIAGRDLTWDDIHSRRPVVMISEKLARELWGSAPAALGRRIHEGTAKPQWREIVGVVENVRDDGVRKPSPLTVYWPFAMENFNGAPLRVPSNVAIAVRSPAAGTESLLKQIRHAVDRVDPNLPLARPRTLEQIYAATMAQTSFALVMLAIAGSMALVLCVVGVYGVIAYTVAQRRREIAVRMALGASVGLVKAMFLHRGIRLAGAGMMLGLAAATGLSRVMSTLLFGITPLDPMAYGATAVMLLIAAMAAAYLPARRAAKVDPMVALRYE